jgi:hypothetical protein
LFVSPATSFSIFYQSCFLLHSLSFLLPSLFSISPAASFSILIIPASFSFLYQSCYFSFFISPATFFSILYQ